MAQQAQRMGTRFLHQLTSLGGNNSHDNSAVQSHSGGGGSGSNSSPVKNQLASLFKGQQYQSPTSQSSQPAETPPVPSYQHGQTHIGDTSAGSTHYGEALGGTSPNPMHSSQPLQRTVTSMDEPRSDESNSKMGRFGFGKLGQFGKGTVQQTTQAGAGAGRLGKQGVQGVGHMGQQGIQGVGHGVEQVGHLGQNGLHTVGQGVTHVGHYGQEGIQGVGQFGQQTVQGVGHGATQAGQFGQQGAATIGHLGQEGVHPDMMHQQGVQAGQGQGGMYDAHQDNPLPQLPNGYEGQANPAAMDQTSPYSRDGMYTSQISTEPGSTSPYGGEGPSSEYPQQATYHSPELVTTGAAGFQQDTQSAYDAGAQAMTTPYSGTQSLPSNDTSLMPVPVSVPAPGAMESSQTLAVPGTSQGASDASLSPNRQRTQWSGTSPNSGHKRLDPEEIATMSRSYYSELLQFFRTQPTRTSLLTTSRSNAREKLTRLNKQQFAELSTDVHDELQRRQDLSQTSPYLPVRDDFHPKRNQARQKLSTLPKSRFRDLASDVFFELERRYPELPQELRHESLEELMGPRDVRASQVSTEAPSSAPSSAPPPPMPGMASQTRVDTMPVATHGMSGTAPPITDTSVLSSPVLTDRTMVTPLTSTTTTTTAATTVDPPPTTGEPMSPIAEVVSVTTGRSTPAAPAAPAEAQQHLSDDMAEAQQQMMEAPPATETRPRAATPREAATEEGAEEAAPKDNIDAPTPAPRDSTTLEPLNSAQFKAFQDQVMALQTRVQELEAQEHKLQRSIDMAEQQVQDMEQRNLSLETRLAQTERERDHHVATSHDWKSKSEQHKAELEDQHAQLLQHRADLDALRTQYNDLQLSQATRAAPAAAQPDPDIEARWKADLDAMQQQTLEQEQMVQDLRKEVGSLLEELRRLSARNDAMTADKESDVAIIRDLHQQMSTYKRRYESTKTELRMVQSTSQLWAQPNVEEWKYVSERGAIADTNLQSFQGAVDELLTAARSATSSNVLIAMKTVVLATTLITDDVAKYELQPDNELTSLTPQQREDVQSLKFSVSEALSNLMNACRNHASSQGLAPVSLVDAAATHVALAIVELIKLLKLRRVPKPAEDDGSFDTNAELSQPSGLKPLHMLGAASPSSSFLRQGPTQRRASSAAQSPALRSLSYSHSNLDTRTMKSPTTAAALGSPSPLAKSTSTHKLNGAATAAKSGDSEAPPKRDLPRVPSTSKLATEGTQEAPDTQPTRTTTLATEPKDATAQPAALGASTTSTSTSTSPAIAATSPVLPAPGTDVSSGKSPVMTTTSSVPAGSSATPVAANEEAAQEDWAELRNYIEVQTEAIVHSIQSLLSALREGAQSVQLNENLTQITTIVSSIVAITRDNLPQASSSSSHSSSMAEEAEAILAELTENCDRLSDMQSNATYDRTAKSVMASASYGVAKGLKALNELLNASGAETPMM